MSLESDLERLTLVEEASVAAGEPLETADAPTAATSGLPEGYPHQDEGKLSQPPVVVSNPRVYVGNISYTTDWREIKDLMRTMVGPCLRVDLITHPNGQSKGCAIVEFETNELAAKAIQTLNGVILGGRKIFVREDREPKGFMQRRRADKGPLFNVALPYPLGVGVGVLPTHQLAYQQALHAQQRAQLASAGPHFQLIPATALAPHQVQQQPAPAPAPLVHALPLSVPVHQQQQHAQPQYQQQYQYQQHAVGAAPASAYGYPQQAVAYELSQPGSASSASTGAASASSPASSSSPSSSSGAAAAPAPAALVRVLRPTITIPNDAASATSGVTSPNSVLSTPLFLPATGGLSAGDFASSLASPIAAYSTLPSPATPLTGGGAAPAAYHYLHAQYDVQQAYPVVYSAAPSPAPSTPGATAGHHFYYYSAPSTPPAPLPSAGSGSATATAGSNGAYHIPVVRTASGVGVDGRSPAAHAHSTAYWTGTAGAGAGAGAPPTAQYYSAHAQYHR